MFVLAWLAYPGLQLIALVTEGRGRCLPGNAALQRNTALQKGHSCTEERASGELSNVASSLLDLVVPTVWLGMAGDAAYVAYRSIGSTVGHVVLFPRYWYVVSGSSRSAPESIWRFTLSVMAVSVVTSLGYQWFTRLVPVEAMLWSVIPVLFSSGTAPTYSRLRQECLRRGDIVSPAVSSVAGRIAELLLLLFLAGIGRFPPHVTILAYCGTAVSAVVLEWRVGRWTRRK